MFFQLKAFNDSRLIKNNSSFAFWVIKFHNIIFSGHIYNKVLYKVCGVEFTSACLYIIYTLCQYSPWHYVVQHMAREQFGIDRIELYLHILYIHTKVIGYMEIEYREAYVLMEFFFFWF